MAFPLFERVDMRTEVAKHWRMNDGSMQASITIVPQHYLDENQSWQNIDSSIVDPVAVAIPKQPINGTLSKNGGWAHSNHFTTPYNKVDLRLPKNIKSGYQIGHGQDRLTFTPQGASPSLGQVNPTSPNEIDYQDVWVDTDITLQSQVEGIKETIVLKSNNSPTTFSFKVDGAVADDWTSGSLKILPPWYVDANGTRKDATITQTTQGNSTIIDISVDTTEMSFPVVVDPSVTLNENSVSADTFVYAGSTSQNYGTQTGFDVGWQTTSQDYDGLIQFNLSSLPAGYSVTSATMQLYLVTGNSSNPNGYINTQRITSSWSETTVTYSSISSNTVTRTNDGNGQSGLITNVGQYWSIPITQSAQQWANGQPNYGLFLTWTVANGSYPNYAAFVARENGNVNTGPTLTINYNTPPSAPTVTSPNGGETINTTFPIKWTAASNSDAGTYFGYSGTGQASAYVIQNNAGAVLRVAQVFTAPSNMYGISTVQVRGAANGSASQITVDIYSVSGGAPTNTKLNSTSPVINLPSDGAYHDNTVGFGSVVPISPNQQFAVVVSAYGNASNASLIPENTTAPASQMGTAYQQSYGSTTWSAQAGVYFSMGVTPTNGPSSLTYQIDLSQNNGSSWTNIVSSTSAGATSYTYDFTNTPASSTNLIRVRAYDGTAYGPYDQSNGVFTIQHDRAPTSPTNLSPSSGAVDHTQPITASWTYNDPDTGDSQSKFNIKWSTNNGSTWTEVDGTVTASTSYTWTANTFPDGTVVQWMVQTYDTSGLNSPWSAQAQFTAGSVPGTPTITSPANNATVSTANPTIQWSSSGQTDYQLQLQDTSSNVLWDSGDVISTNVAATLTGYNLANSTSYELALRVKNSEGLWSLWTKNTIAVSYTPPAQATTTATPDNANARITVTIANPAPSGSQPTVDHNDLYRRNTGTTIWTRIATQLPANSTYQDYAVASGQGYDYNLTAIGANGTQVDSTVVSASVEFSDLWLHDVDDPSGTILSLPYNTARSETWTPDSTVMKFAGRSKPVMAFGEQEEYSLKIDISITTAQNLWPALSTLARKKTTICLRDTRGRKIFGVVTSLPETDETYGQSTSFEVTEVDYTEAV